MPRLLAVQHSHAEFLGALEPQLERRGISFRYVRPVAGEDVAGGPTQHDALCLLGAAWPPADAGHSPWLADEVRLVRAFQRARRPVFGFGPGAQPIAAAQGAALHATPPFEGRLAVAVAADADDPLAHAMHGRRVLVLGCGDCEMPGDASVVLRDAEGGWLAFRTRAPGYGLRFRPELKPGMLEDMAMEEDRPLPADFGDLLAAVREAWGELEQSGARAAAALVAALGLMDERPRPRVIPISAGH